MSRVPTAKCATPDCPNKSYRLHCPSCLAEEVAQRLLRADTGACMHGHSITGSFETIQRLLPEYTGGPPQPGYILDICKLCLMELRERPIDPGRTHGISLAFDFDKASV